MVALLAAAAILFSPMIVSAETASEIDRDVDNSITSLYAGSPTAKELSTVAKGMLVFPSVVKGGLIIGGQYGTGALRVEGKTDGITILSLLHTGFRRVCSRLDIPCFS